MYDLFIFNAHLHQVHQYIFHINNNHILMFLQVYEHGILVEIPSPHLFLQDCFDLLLVPEDFVEFLISLLAGEHEKSVPVLNV